MTLKAGRNNVFVACTLELINFIRGHAGNEDMNEGFWLIKEFLMVPKFKAEFIERYGTEKYKDTLKHYSVTNIQQKKLKDLKRQAQEIKKEKAEEAQREIDRLKAESYDKQTALASNKKLRGLENKRSTLEKEIETGRINAPMWSDVESKELTPSEIEKRKEELKRINAQIKRLTPKS